jgi:RNA polymerase sigma-70 factor (TIGR02943 family)
MENVPKINPDAWVDQYGDALFHFALARVSNREVAEDLVQETFLAAVKSQDRFKGQSSEKTWLFAILKHKVIDHYRQSKPIVHTQGGLRELEDMDTFFNANGSWHIRPQNWRADPGKSQAVREALDHFYQCLADLPQKTADVFVHREIDGLNTKEICKQLDITPANCWVILYRARVLLRTCLESMGYGRQKEEHAS